MPRFDEGIEITKLEYADILLTGNPGEYSKILAQNILVEDITRASLQTLITNSRLVRGKLYRITNAVGSTLSIIVQALTANTLGDISYNSATGDIYTYSISTDTGSVGLNLGENGLNTGFVTYDTTPTNTPTSQATTYWDSTEETLALIMNGVTQRVGLDTFFNAKNSTGTSIPKGTAVRFAGTDGNSGNLLIAPMLADGTYPSVYYMGVTAEAIDNGQFGKVMSLGKLRTNTNAYVDGDVLYVSSTVAGGFQTTAPLAPNNIIIAAAVVNAANNGVLEVRATLGSNINNDEGVRITTPLTGQLLQLQSNGLWENKTKAQVLGGTSSQFVKGDGTLDSNTYLTGNQTITLSGQATGSGTTSIAVTLDNAAVINKVLTGLSVSGSAIVSTDSILVALGKVQNQINALAGGVSYQGTWNASTNTPSLTSSVGTKGYYYVVSVAGSTNLNGITDWKLGDWVIFNGSTWDKVDNTDAVISVNGYTGIVTLAKGDIGLGNVENTALSTWAGSTNITTIKSLTSSATEIITFGATDTGEAHIFGGTMRVNGATTLSSTLAVTGALTGSSTAQFTKLGLGVAPLTTITLAARTNITGGISAFGISQYGIVQSDVTSTATSYYSELNTVAGSYTINEYYHFRAFQNSIGAGSAITTQVGYNVSGSMVGATNNYGFRGSLPSGTGRWNAYMEGTAANYFAGKVQIGSTTDGGELLQVTGTARITGATAIGSTLTVTGNILPQATATYDLGVTGTRWRDLFLSRNLEVGNIFDVYESNLTTAHRLRITADTNGAILNATRSSGNPSIMRFQLDGVEVGRFNSSNNFIVTNGATIGGTLSVTGALTGSSTAQFTRLGLGIAPDNFNTIKSNQTITSGGSNNFGINQLINISGAITVPLIVYNYATQGTISGGATITTQSGFVAESTLIGATNNFGFFGGIPSGTGRWNFYANGTAANYFAGKVQIGSTTDGGELLQVTGTARITSNLQVPVVFNTGVLTIQAQNNQYAFSGTALYPMNDNFRDLGITSTNRWRDLFLGRNAEIGGTLAVTGALSIGNTVATAVSVASTHKVTIVIGGVTYYLLATNV
jgi:hypothetical protein